MAAAFESGAFELTAFDIASGGAVAVNPAAGALAIAGFAPAITQTANQSLAPGAGALSLAGYAPTLAQSANADVQPVAGSMSIAGYAPSVAQSSAVDASPSAGALSITGFAPTITQGVASPDLQPATGLLTIVGYAPTVAQFDATAAVALPGGGVVGSSRDIRAFAARLDSAQRTPKPSKAAKALRRKQIEAEVLELLPDEPGAASIAPQIALAVYRKEAQAATRWTPSKAMQPVADQAEAIEAAAHAAQFDATEVIRAMVMQWLQNEAIERELEDEMDVEMLLMG